MEVSFNVNGVDITIGSTLVMRATRNQSMTLSLIEGHGMIKTAYGSQAIRPGEQVSVQLGGANGLEAISAPSDPVAFGEDETLSGLTCVLDHLSGKLCEGETSSYSSPKPTAVPAMPSSSSNSNSGNNSQSPSKVSTKISPTKVSSPTKPPKPTYPPKPTKRPKRH
jgi:hypothetical protein